MGDSAGSFSRSAVNHESGAKTGLSGVAMGLTMACALFFLTPLFRDIPQVTIVFFFFYHLIYLYFVGSFLIFLFLPAELSFSHILTEACLLLQCALAAIVISVGISLVSTTESLSNEIYIGCICIV